MLRSGNITKPNLKPLEPADVVAKLKNLRQPTLNLVQCNR